MSLTGKNQINARRRAIPTLRRTGQDGSGEAAEVLSGWTRVARDAGRSCLHYAEGEAVCAEPWAGVGCESLSMQMEASRCGEVS